MATAQLSRDGSVKCGKASVVAKARNGITVTRTTASIARRRSATVDTARYGDLIGQTAPAFIVGSAFITRSNGPTVLIEKGRCKSLGTVLSFLRLILFADPDLRQSVCIVKRNLFQAVVTAGRTAASFGALDPA